MPLIRPSKLPPPPELGEKTFWDYFPKRSSRRILFLLIALGAVIFLKSSGGGTFGGLFEPARRTPAELTDDSAFRHIEVEPRLEIKPPHAASTPKSLP